MYHIEIGRDMGNSNNYDRFVYNYDELFQITFRNMEIFFKLLELEYIKTTEKSVIML